MHKRLFVILWCAGFLGIFSLLMIDITGLLEILQLPQDSEASNMSPWAIKGLSLIQPTILLSVAVLAGVGLANKVGLAAPVAEAFAKRDEWLATLWPQLGPGIVGGIAGGLAIVATSMIFLPLLPPEAVVLIRKFGALMPLPTRLLYGGIAEEVLLRWGLMTLIVWIIWRLFQRTRKLPSASAYVAATVVSSVVFGIGHLPIAFLLFAKPDLALITFVVVANSLFGIIAGVLFWKRGLESAMIAHIVTHVVLFSATSLGAYF